MTRNEQLKEAIEQFKHAAPELSDAQRQQFIQAWWNLQDTVRDIFWDDSWLKTTGDDGEMTDEGMQEEAMHTTGALGAAMLETYSL